MKMKEHIHREMVNELRDIAIRYHATQQLREVISGCVNQKLKENQEWQAQASDDALTRALAQNKIYEQALRYVKSWCEDALERFMQMDENNTRRWRKEILFVTSEALAGRNPL